jgi:hypothetical protein
MAAEDGDGMGLLRKAQTIRSGESISPEERAEIQAHIDTLFTEQRSNLTEWSEDYRNAKRGTLLPVSVNVFGLFVVVVGTVLLFSQFSRAEASITAPAAAAISTETAILSSVRESARQQLAEREAEIARIRAELQNARSSGGTTGSSPAIDELEAALAALLAQQEASRALTDASERDAEAAFFSQQLRRVYAEAGDALELGDTERALARLEDADNVVAQMEDQGGFTSEMAAVARASNSTIRTAARFLRLEESQAAPEPAPGPDVLETITSLVEQADSRWGSGDTAGAERLYRAALGEIEAVEAAYSRLEELDQADAEDVTGELSNRVRQLEAQVRNARETVAELRSSTEERQVRVAAERRIIEEQLEVILARVEEAAAERIPASIESTGNLDREPEVIDLLESKLALREVLESPTVESDYPEAQEDFEAYVQNYGRERYLMGWRDAIDESIEGIDSLLLSLGTPRRPPPETEELSPSDSLRALFRRLDELLRVVALGAQDNS